MSEPLTLVQLLPDRDAFAQCAAEMKLCPAGTDLGYAWHSLLKVAFGDLGPQPFVDRIAMRSNEVLGYVKATPEALLDCSINRAHDALVAKATGMGHLRAKQLPTVWRQGRQLSFEARARPVVRSRRNPRSGALDEVDVALHRAAQDPSVTRERAYLDWIAGQLMRDGAAQLLSATLHAFCRTRVARQSNTTNGRRIVQSEGPDVWIRGTLQIERPDAFDSLLRRGVGRHRAFGFGCMLVAPAGVFA